MNDLQAGKWKRGPRVLDPASALGRHGARSCLAQGCAEATREDKPYCPAHVELNPYVQEILARMARLEFERERVRQRGVRGVDLRGETAQELLRELRVYGPRTCARLAKVLGIELASVSTHVAALQAAGLVTRSVGERGQEFVALAQASPRGWRRWSSRGNAAERAG